MKSIRELSVENRLAVYSKHRIEDQANWYSRKSLFNKHRAGLWFIILVILHAIAILMLLYRINNPAVGLPVEVVAAASSVLTWLQAKKHNELNYAYTLAAHEIVLIKGELLSVMNEKQLSGFVVNSEAAFSREYTQWTARKGV